MGECWGNPISMQSLRRKTPSWTADQGGPLVCGVGLIASFYLVVLLVIYFFFYNFVMVRSTSKLLDSGPNRFYAQGRSGDSNSSRAAYNSHSSIVSSLGRLFHGALIIFHDLPHGHPVHEHQAPERFHQTPRTGKFHPAPLIPERQVTIHRSIVHSDREALMPR